ncbi:MAG: aldo/keto reductase, partial [Pseudomonadota bacterium]|nr:aldo/keto reductase [Pseudomonadota bacterium]
MLHEMLTREIGRSGIEASAIGLGTWAIGGWMWGGTDEAKSISAIQASIDEGISLIDTAPAYGQGLSEEIVGKAIAGRREKVVLATKCGLVWHTQKGNHFFDYDGKPVHRYLGKDAIVHEVEQSLKRLGTDHIDHYITHWQDPTTPIAETMEALETLKTQG